MIVDCDHATEGRLYTMLKVLLTGLAGILIASYNQAEMFIPSTKETFSLPAIPGSPRVWHTLTGTVLCGGAYPGTSTNCLQLKENGAGWQSYSSSLNKSRMAHSAWDSPSGVLLMGGYYSGDSTELLTSTGSTSQFSLNYKIRLVGWVQPSPHLQLFLPPSLTPLCPLSLSLFLSFSLSLPPFYSAILPTKLF